MKPQVVVHQEPLKVIRIRIKPRCESCSTYTTYFKQAQNSRISQYEFSFYRNDYLDTMVCSSISWYYRHFGCKYMERTQTHMDSVFAISSLTVPTHTPTSKRAESEHNNFSNTNDLRQIYWRISNNTTEIELEDCSPIQIRFRSYLELDAKMQSPCRSTCQRQAVLGPLYSYQHDVQQLVMQK